MLEPRWLQESVVRAIHSRQLSEHGGLEGVRDAGLLSSALAKPRNLFAYGDPPPDIAALAASNAFGIIKNHPFSDGNKRTAYVICRTFLKLNGQDIDATDVEKYRTFMGVAEGTLIEEHLAEWIRTKLC
ncbi:MAG: type II toxin-antitoxin system death-on-curing family toxin [Pirellulales bacterium]